MNATTTAQLDYLHGTLFGPIPKTANCMVVITAITPGAFQIDVAAPVPDDLHKAHSLVITVSAEQRLSGTVVHARKLEDGGLELQIDV